MAEKRAVQQAEPVTFAQLYLIVYNFAQCLGWTLMMLSMGFHWIGKDTYVGMYDNAKIWLNIFQTLAILEVVHAMTGLVRSNWVLTAFQVASRVFVTWHTYNVPEAQDSPGVAMFLVAWGVTEIIRYSFYMCAQVNNVPYLVTWARYTFFFVLYPLGVTGELTTLYHSLSYVQKTGMWSLRLPNTLNFGFDYHHFLIFLMFAAYLPIFPQLYMHMIGQRKKVLGGGGGSKKHD